MDSLSVRRTAGALLMFVPLVFTVCFLLLGVLFEYPAILRQPTPDVLEKFVAGGTPLLAVWYALTLTAVAFVPVVVLVHRVLAGRHAPVLLWVATAFGLIAGLSQTLGFLRWPFLVPHLAQAYLAPGASEAQRAAASMVFEAFHRYAGLAIGEHLGYLSTSVWTMLISIVMLRTGAVARWLAAPGAVLAVGVAAGLPEAAGWELGGTINALSYFVWALWLIALGGALLVWSDTPNVAERRAPLLGTPQAAVL